MPKGKKNITADQFVVAWNKASTPEAAAKALGITVEAAKVKASMYRRKGIKGLQKFVSQRGGPRLDIAALSALASKNAPKKRAAA